MPLQVGAIKEVSFIFTLQHKNPIAAADKGVAKEQWFAFLYQIMHHFFSVVKKNINKN